MRLNERTNVGKSMIHPLIVPDVLRHFHNPAIL